MEMPEGLLRQVLYNILVNAIEASPQGGVVKIMTEVDNEILTLLISDQGVGIPLEVQPRLFDPFFTSKKIVPERVGTWPFRFKRHCGEIGWAYRF